MKLILSLLVVLVNLFLTVPQLSAAECSRRDSKQSCLGLLEANGGCFWDTKLKLCAPTSVVKAAGWEETGIPPFLGENGTAG